MGVITISLSKETEELLRKLASQEFPGQKGAISRILEAGIQAYLEQKKSRDAKERAFSRMRKGFDLGGGPYYRERGELHD